NTQAPIVDVGAETLLRPEHLVLDRIVDSRGDDFAFAFECDRDREMRQAVEEVSRAVEGVDDEAMAGIASRLKPAFFQEKSVIWPGFAEFALEHLFGCEIGGRDELSGPF